MHTQTHAHTQTHRHTLHAHTTRTHARPSRTPHACTAHMRHNYACIHIRIHTYTLTCTHAHLSTCTHIRMHTHFPSQLEGIPGTTPHPGTRSPGVEAPLTHRFCLSQLSHTQPEIQIQPGIRCASRPNPALSTAAENRVRLESAGPGVPSPLKTLRRERDLFLASLSHLQRGEKLTPASPSRGS